MTIKGFTDDDIKARLIIMLKLMGFTNDRADNVYSWWCRINTEGVILEMFAMDQLMNNNLLLCDFLTRIIGRIGLTYPLQIDYARYEWKINIPSLKINKVGISLIEVMFLGINEYLIIKNHG